MRIPPIELQSTNRRVDAQEIYKGKTVNLTLLQDAAHIPPLSAITSVAVVPFVEHGVIVSTVLDRGLDIPGGHVEAIDEDAAATALRECIEETAATLETPLTLIGLIESDFGETPTYMVITAAKVRELHPFEKLHEAHARELVSTAEFLARYDAGSKEMMTEIIRRAERSVGERIDTET